MDTGGSIAPNLHPQGKRRDAFSRLGRSVARIDATSGHGAVFLELTVAFCCNVRVLTESLLVKARKIGVEVKNEKLITVKHAS